MWFDGYESYYELFTLSSSIPCSSASTLIQKRNELCFYCIEANYCHIHEGKGLAFQQQCPSNEFREMCKDIDTAVRRPKKVKDHNLIKSEHVTKSIVDGVDVNQYIRKLTPSSTDDEYDSDATVPALDDGIDGDEDVEDYESENIKKIVFTKAIGDEVVKTRMRPKKFVCDVCDASFTLKQNVQWHLHKYHMINGPIPVVTSKIRYKCIPCKQMVSHLSSSIMDNDGGLSMAISPFSSIYSSSSSCSSSQSIESTVSSSTVIPCLSSQSIESTVSSSTVIPCESSQSMECTVTPCGLSTIGRSVGEVLVDETIDGSPFLSTMRSLFERAAQEKERKEKKDNMEKKRLRLEMKIRQMTLRLQANNNNDNIDKLFKSACAAATHDKKVHKKPIKGEIKVKDPIVCEECGKTFASTFQLKEHISILHLRERKFACEVCGQKFGRRGGVRRHVQMVHLNQLHKCPYEGCDHPGYKCSKALAAHIRSVHTNDRPFECEECGKNFVRRNDLKMHVLTHNEEATYHCSCGSSFRRALYLKKHKRNCVSASNESLSPDDTNNE